MVLEYSSTWGEADGTGVQPSSDLGGVFVGKPPTYRISMYVEVAQQESRIGELIS